MNSGIITLIETTGVSEYEGRSKLSGGTSVDESVEETRMKLYMSSVDEAGGRVVTLYSGLAVAVNGKLP